MITWDTVNKGTNVINFGNNNLTVSITNAYGSARATTGKTTGKWYWEIKVDVNNASMIGIVSKTGDLNTNLALSSNAILYYGDSGAIYPSGTNYGSAYGKDSVIGVALNLDVGELSFFVNGVSKGVAVNNISSMGEVFPVVTSGSSSGGGTFTANFGATSFIYGLPERFQPYDLEYSREWNSFNKFLISSGGSKYYSIKTNDPNINLVPKMTSNTSPSGVASSSSIVTDERYFPYRAFNETNLDANDVWLTGNGVLTGWLEYKFNRAEIVNKYTITSINLTNSNLVSPVNWTIQGSNDGVNYTIIHEVIDENSWGVNQTKSFSFINQKSFKHYRINVTKVSGTSYVAIANFRMHSDASILTKIGSANLENKYFDYGMSKNNIINLESRILIVNYIIDQNETLSSGKLFKQKINTSIHPIKNVTIS